MSLTKIICHLLDILWTKFGQSLDLDKLWAKFGHRHTLDKVFDLDILWTTMDKFRLGLFRLS